MGFVLVNYKIAEMYILSRKIYFFFSVVTLCNELELFDFSGCDLVTNATLQAALDSVKFRTNNIKLTLVVGGEFDYSVVISTCVISKVMCMSLLFQKYKLF
jgi:hypothetical protein